MNIEIDLKDCLTARPWSSGGWGNRASKSGTHYYLDDEAKAREAYKAVKLTQNIEKAETVTIRIPDETTHINYMFIGALIGPAARKVGPDEFEKKLRIAGGRDNQGWRGRYGGGGFDGEFAHWLKELRKRNDKKKEQVTKVEKENVWSPPQALFVPDIGTALRLALPWDMMLHAERRNHGFIEFIDPKDASGGRWSYYRKDRERNSWAITINPGAVLKVDRVYIRNGGSSFADFSSLTFRMEKGAEVVYNGNTLTTAKNIRFWAKLRDVNTMLAEVDMNTLPGQEREGTARKD